VTVPRRYSPRHSFLIFQCATFISHMRSVRVCLCVCVWVYIMTVCVSRLLCINVWVFVLSCVCLLLLGFTCRSFQCLTAYTIVYIFYFPRHIYKIKNWKVALFEFSCLYNAMEHYLLVLFNSFQTLMVLYSLLVYYLLI